MIRFVALFVIVFLAGIPAVFAESVTVGDYLYVANWKLPKSHAYQAVVNGNHVDIGAKDVYDHVVVKTPVLDKTAFQWVYHPDTGPNPKYQYTGKLPTATKPTPTKPTTQTPSTGGTAPKPVTGGGGSQTPPAPKPPAPVVIVVPPPPAPAPAPQPKTKPAPAPVATVVADGPNDKDDCKDDGWKRYTSPSFKNQGDCVSWTNHNGGKGKGRGKGKDK